MVYAWFQILILYSKICFVKKMMTRTRLICCNQVNIILKIFFVVILNVALVDQHFPHAPLGRVWNMNGNWKNQYVGNFFKIGVQ